MADPGNQSRPPFVSQTQQPPNGQYKPQQTEPNGSFSPGVTAPITASRYQPPQPGQWTGNTAQPPFGVNGYGVPGPQQHLGTNMSSGAFPAPPSASGGIFNPVGQPPLRAAGHVTPLQSSQTSGPPQMNGPSSMSRLPQPPPIPGTLYPSQQGVRPPSAQGHAQSQNMGPSSENTGAPPSSVPGASAISSPSNAGHFDQSRPNELPVPFHGHGQYSHQVNPFMQKTPTQTPGNSEPPSQKSSRGSSPVSGPAIDALEGQFTPGYGSPSPSLQGVRNSPIPGPAPGTPPKAAGTIMPPAHNTPPSVAKPGPVNPSVLGQNQPPPTFPPGAQQLPPKSGLPPGGPSFTPQGQITQQPLRHPAPPLQGPPTVQRYPPSTSGPALGLPRNPGPAGSFPPPSTIGPAPAPFAPPPPMTGSTPPVSNSSTGFPPPPPAPNTSGGLPPSSAFSTATGLPPAVPPVYGGAPPPPRVPSGPTSQMPGTVPPPNSQYGPVPPTSQYGPITPTSQYRTLPQSSQYGAMPPTSQYGTVPAPPTSQYGTAPPSQYGTAPPTSQYGTAPASQYGTAPSPQYGTAPPPPPQYGTAPPTSQYGAMPPPQYGPVPPTGQMVAPPGTFPTPPQGQPGQTYQNSVSSMGQNFAQMGIQDSQRALNLLNERQLIPPEGIETARPVLPHDFKKVNCSPDIFRCTLNAIPQNSALLTKARLPLGILIHPFRDLSQLPVIQSSVIVRCRSCRTYINPFVVFIDQRRWKCNLCFRVNDLPDEFSFDPVSKTYGDPQRRPEVKSATIEFIAPSEYMLRPPQPAVYLFLLDVSFNAVETGYLSNFCQILLDELDKLPGDARTSIGFVCYDRALYFFNLAEGLSQPQMMCVPDLEEPFLPCPDNLLVNLHESKELVVELLNQLPSLFAGNLETGSALGAALQSAQKLLSPTGGRVTVMQTCLPTVGPGALQNRDAGSNPGKDVTNIGPATDFYKKLSLDCSAQQISVDLFMLNGQYSDIATLSCISKYSAGSILYFPSFHTVRNPNLVDKFDTDLRRYLTRKIGFESVMRIRCTRGLSIHTFHGNFFVRSTDLLSLPNINPDAGFGMQMSIEDNLNESTTVSFQAALLYTSSKGERRIRVHTLCVPVTNQIGEVFASADQEALAALLAKMAVDRSMNSAISDARDAMINAPLDTLMAYSQQIPASQRVGALLSPYSLRLMPMFMLAMLKSLAFSLGGNTKLDDRVFAMQQCKVQPIAYLIQCLYPHLYPLHRLSDEKTIKRGKTEIPTAPRLQLSSANIDRTGLFLMDTGESMYLLVGSSIGDEMCQEVFDKPNFMSIPDNLTDLPEVDNPRSERICSFVNYLMDSRPHGVTFLVIRDDSKNRHLFFQHMLEDRTENSMSYYEFLQFLQGKAKG